MVRLLPSLAVTAFTIFTSPIAASPVPTPPSSSESSSAHTPFPGWRHQCTEHNIQIRRDFQKMAPWERKAYTDAVKCLMDQPSNLDQAQYPGAINRFFDYAAIHINRTSEVHLDGFFLTWHRMFVWLFEQDLQNICGYKGTQPYWFWPGTADDLTGSALFDGSEHSMSGDGVYVDNGPVVLTPTFQFPHGSGGGCVTTGPFAHMDYTMPVIPITVLINGEPLPANAFSNQPTCLTRDLNTQVAKSQTNLSQWLTALDAPDQATFDVLMNGIPGKAQLGLHSGAHFVLGSPSSSLFSSAQDPIWYPLHTMLDYTYWVWQQKHPENAWDLSGTKTAVNIPPSDNVTLESWEPDWGYLMPSVQVSDLMSTTSGPFCYSYEP